MEEKEDSEKKYVEVVIGRSPSDVKKYGSKGAILLGKQFIEIENKLVLAGNMYMDVSGAHVVFICGTDFGTQTSTFCSPRTYRNLWMPYYKKVNDWIHENTSWKTFKHCCGSVRSLIPSFIESGFDILNPVQCSAANMDAQELKNEFGEKIVFWGGGVDTQKTLPFGTPGEVRREVFERCEIFSENGGFVFSSIHNIQANTPVENIVAMLDAVHEFNE